MDNSVDKYLDPERPFGTLADLEVGAVLLKASALPRGIAVVRVQTVFGKIVAVSNRLTDQERLVALAIAFHKIHEGAMAVVLSEMEVVAALADVA